MEIVLILSINFINFIFFYTFIIKKTNNIIVRKKFYQKLNLYNFFRGKMMYTKILLTTDGSENAERAGKHALWIANVSGADILVLNVFEVYTPSMAILPLSTLPGSNEDLYEPLKDEAENIAENFRLKLESLMLSQDFKNNIRISTRVRDGKAYQEILRTIDEEDIDLVVMGASGRHGLDRITLGSVTERVVRESKVPVMVIP